MVNIYFSSEWCCPLLICCNRLLPWPKHCEASVIRVRASFLLQQKSGSLLPLCCLLGRDQGPFHEALELQHGNIRIWGLGRCGQHRAGSPSPLWPSGRLIPNYSLELEWSQALVAEQKFCCPQRHHLCDLWPQKHFSQSGLKGKEVKWCKKTPQI